MKYLFAKLFTLPENNRVFGLDFLRTIAILAVVLTHGNLFFPAEQQVWINTVFSLAGGLGVELFFVLSGFLIGSILLSLEPKFHQIRTLPNFWLRRWFRTIPNYWFFLILYIIASLIVSNPIPNLFSYLTFTQNWLWTHPFFFDQAWSLSIEEWFYFLFPISIFLLFRLTKSFHYAFILSACIFIIIPTGLRIQWAFMGVSDENEIFRKTTLLRLDAIMYGVIAAWLKQKNIKSWRIYRYHFLAAGIFLQTIILFMTTILNFNPSFFAKTFLFSLVSLSFAFILPAFDLWKNQRNNKLATSIRLISLWSYSLYLCNFLVVQVLTDILEMLGSSSIIINMIFFFLYLVASFTISCIIYTFIEKPAMDIRERLPHS